MKPGDKVIYFRRKAGGWYKAAERINATVDKLLPHRVRIILPDGSKKAVDRESIELVTKTRENESRLA